MKLVESVYEISETFMKNPELVFMNDNKINNVAEDMLDAGRPIFSFPVSENIYKQIVIELVASSVNYCYWYGKHNIRPNGSSSTLMYECLQNAFFDYEHPDKKQFKLCIERFIQLMSIKRFPLIEERERHLRQLLNGAEEYAIIIESHHEDGKVEEYMSSLISYFSGFASDIFLKRASLFFIQLFRCFGWFEPDLHNLHVPADYQIPKMLNHYGCLIYEEELDDAIDFSQPLPKHSQAECEIRAATVLTIKKLCEITGWNVAEVDGYFFSKRYETKNPFHLCITTDY